LTKYLCHLIIIGYQQIENFPFNSEFRVKLKISVFSFLRNDMPTGVVSGKSEDCFSPKSTGCKTFRSTGYFMSYFKITMKGGNVGGNIVEQVFIKY